MGLAPRQTDWRYTASRKVTLTLTLLESELRESLEMVIEDDDKKVIRL
jgi:hypothetical protein